MTQPGIEPRSPGPLANTCSSGNGIVLPCSDYSSPEEITTAYEFGKHQFPWLIRMTRLSEYMLRVEKNQKKKINSKSVEIPRSSWQEVVAAHAQRKDRLCAKEKFNLTSASTVALSGPSFTWALAANMYWFSLVPWYLAMSAASEPTLLKQTILKIPTGLIPHN